MVTAAWSTLATSVSARAADAEARLGVCDGTVLLVRTLFSCVSDEPDASGGADAETGTVGAGRERTESGPTPDAGDPDDEGEGAFGEAVPDVPVEPGTPSVENVAFVFLGVASTVALILHLVSLIG